VARKFAAPDLPGEPSSKWIAGFHRSANRIRTVDSPAARIARPIAT
jgi:hypothetical protein